MDYEKIYAYRFATVDQAAKDKVWLELSSFVYDLMERPDKILDPAGGMCEFIRSVKSAKERWVVDKMLPPLELLHDIQFVHGDIFNVELPPAYFDGVFISNFLEHLGSHDEVYSLLVKLRESMRERGVIAIMGPNFKYAFKDYFDCADHKLALTHIAVEELLYSAGFKIEKVIPRFIPYSFRGKLPSSKMLTRAYLGMPFFWRFFGKQFLILARS